jgi:N-acetylmuramoyl-L-alanine amidase
MSGFAPDSPLVASIQASPNQGERRSHRRPDLIVLHYTGMESAEAALARLCGVGSDPEPGVSAHYFVWEDGRVVQCVPEARRAWHAGVSSWEGEEDINSRSIGIEIANPGHDFGYPDFPEPQIRQVIALCRDIVGRNLIRADRVLAHSDVAPSRKQDPGEKFPWRRLFEAGVGHWIEPTPIADGPALKLGDRSAGVSQLQGLLAEYGYGLNPTGFYGDQTRDVVAAFQRHFRPARVDGIADGSTLDTLERLLIGRRLLLAAATDLDARAP